MDEKLEGLKEAYLFYKKSIKRQRCNGLGLFKRCRRMVTS